ncbi:MAG: hypothetical protein BBJ57_09190 [Desulfobacterales bacterium PC51MH44]|nr:MAG: hypothetical protein BBJ57_09190 [Desulfobacterales bacterium PC51MH44]
MQIEIIEQQALVPDKGIIAEVIERHPISKELCIHVKTIFIEKAEKESIEYDVYSKKVILNLTQNSHEKENFKYILFHEFSHVANKARSDFNYSGEVKNSLTDLEKSLVMELWNVYIDSRLNYYGFFMLGPDDANVYGTVDGKLQKLPFTIEGKLLGHTAFLASRGFQDAKFVVEDIWNNPQRMTSYSNLIRIVKERLPNNTLKRDAAKDCRAP